MARRESGVPSQDRRRLRSRRRLWLGVLLFIAGIGAGLVFYPYPPLPVPEVESARAALQEARREARELAPGPLALAAKSSLLMERLYAYDRSRILRFTRLEALDRAIAETNSLAARALAEARQLRTDRLGQGDDQRRQLEAELALLAPDVEFLPPRERGARSAYARAALALAQVAVAHREGDLVRLDASLEDARAQVELARVTLGKRYERFNSPEWQRRWQAWADDTVAASRGGRVAIVVHKLGRRLYLLRDGRVAAEFDADLGRNAMSDKVAAGDGATPEGKYHITEKRANGSTRWYKALLINYPNADDEKAFQTMRRRGELPNRHSPGGLIEIHGHGGKQSNWTDGCVALRNAAMDRLFALVPVGTPVTIVGAAQLPGASRS
jgi:lipoprotein-anchoring transpeptidase ErfK/SrfK